MRISDCSSDVCASDLIAGRSPSKCTSTTAPRTWVILPMVFFAMGSLLSTSTVVTDLTGSQRLGAGDDFDEFLGDVRLARPIVSLRQRIDQVAGIARGVVHGRHAGTLLGREGFEQRPVDLDRQVARQ